MNKFLMSVTVLVLVFLTYFVFFARLETIQLKEKTDSFGDKVYAAKPAYEYEPPKKIKKAKFIFESKPPKAIPVKKKPTKKKTSLK